MLNKILLILGKLNSFYRLFLEIWKSFEIYWRVFAIKIFFDFFLVVPGYSIFYCCPCVSEFCYWIYKRTFTKVAICCIRAITSYNKVVLYQTNILIKKKCFLLLVINWREKFKLLINAVFFYIVLENTTIKLQYIYSLKVTF